MSDLLNSIGKKETETRSKRLQLLLKPSMYEKLSAVAADKGLSVNEFINQLIEIALQ